MKTAMAILTIFVTVLIFVTLISFIPTLLWYTFDDQLAMILGNPLWGEVPFWNVYGFTWFVGFLTKSAGSITSGKE